MFQGEKCKLSENIGKKKEFSWLIKVIPYNLVLVQKEK